MKQKLLFLLIALLPMVSAWADVGDEFTAGGLIYKDTGTGTAAVKGYSTAPTGALVIPMLVTNPETKTTYSVMAIAANAFKGCTGLTSVTLPKSICSIGEDAFNGCTNVTDVYLNTTYLFGKSYFQNWLDDGQDDFKPGRATKCHVIPDLVDIFTQKQNNANTFYPNVTFEALADEEFTVGNLTYRVTDDAKVEVANYVSEPTGALVIPETVTHGGKKYSVTGIRGMAFYGCSGITSVVIPSRVAYIEADAFYGCTGVTDVYCYVNPLILKSWVDGGCDDFRDDGSTKCHVRAVEIYTNVYNNDFYPEKKVNVTFVALEENTFTVDGLIYNITSESPKTVELIGYEGDEPTGALVIPATVNGYAVTSIGDAAFYMCDDLTSLTIPDGVTTIGYMAFSGCSGLTVTTIPASVTTIEADAFMNCGDYDNVTDVYCSILDLSLLDWERGSDSDFSELYHVMTKFHVLSDETEWLDRFGSYIPVNFVAEHVTLTDAGSYTNWDGDIPVASATYQKTIEESRVGKYQAWMLPFDHTITSADAAKFNFYKINMIANAPAPGESSASGDMWVFLTRLSAGDVLHANRPYVYKPKQAVTDGYEFTSAPAVLKPRVPLADYILKTETAEDIYSFYGVYDGLNATASNPFYYVNINGGISYGNSTSVHVGAFRWIIRKTSKFGGESSYVREMHFVVDGEEVEDETGISLTPDPSPVGEGSWYTLDGRKIANGQKPTAKGIYIHNGRKEAVR